MGIEEAWASTCKILLGDEIGEMEKYRNFLTEAISIPGIRKSALSGKEVVSASKNICSSAKFIRNDEQTEYSRLMKELKLDINSIKDFDSIIAAISERAYYSGNIILGNSKEVVESDRCINSSYIHCSKEIYDSKYVAYSNSVRYGEYVFGSEPIGETKFLIKGFDTYKNTRTFNVMRAYVGSDLYYCGNIEGCNNCMFSFNLRNRNYLIGNTQYSKEEYHALKTKLVEDMHQILVGKKTLPTIMDIIGDS
ncbi:hypothetical protein KJ780_03855 [Candidatus Micrarchaeota archaeon]|nr:hypothetical protein [Candidatus Micrarchaeota archaeon]